MASWLGTRDRKTAFLYKVVVVHPSKFYFAVFKLKWTLCISEQKKWRSFNFLYNNWFYQQSERMPCPYSIKKV